MINEEWNKTQNDAPFIAFYDMRAVTFVLPDEMADVSIVGLQWFILNPDQTTRDLTGQVIPIPNPIYIEKKYRIWNMNHPTCCNPTNYKENSHSSLILATSYDMPQRKAEVLFYTVKTPQDPTRNKLYEPVALTNINLQNSLQSHSQTLMVTTLYILIEFISIDCDVFSLFAT